MIVNQDLQINERYGVLVPGEGDTFIVCPSPSPDIDQHTGPQVLGRGRR